MPQGRLHPCGSDSPEAGPISLIATILMHVTALALSSDPRAVTDPIYRCRRTGWVGSIPTDAQSANDTPRTKQSLVRGGAHSPAFHVRPECESPTEPVQTLSAGYSLVSWSCLSHALSITVRGIAPPFNQGGSANR
jgi:hypothetical protein